MTRWLIIIGLVAGCGPRAPAQTSTAPAEASQISSREQLEPKAPDANHTSSSGSTTADAEPASAPAIEQLLRARHAKDLPTRQVLDHHTAPDVALVWLSEHGQDAAVKVRATRTLGLYPDRDHLEYLRGLADSTSPHPTLRAAALDAIAAYPVRVRVAERPLLEKASADADPRVAAAGRRALEGLEASLSSQQPD